jgi:hypothetical protein
MAATARQGLITYETTIGRFSIAGDVLEIGLSTDTFTRGQGRTRWTRFVVGVAVVM